VERKAHLLDRPRQISRFPASWRLALAGIRVEELVSVIARRDEAHRRWGFKRPNILTRLGQRGLSLFREPRIVLCFRDPVAMAQRSAIAEGVEIQEALRNARAMLDANLKAAASLAVPVLMVSFEKVARDHLAFLDELYRFCCLSVSRANYPEIKDFMHKAGCEYKRLTSAPVVGYVQMSGRTVLSGWCHLPKMKGPAAVDVHADGEKLVTVIADKYRPDLAISSFRSPHSGFEVDLRSLHLWGGEMIEVTVSGTEIRLEGSGFSLEQFCPARSGAAESAH
jgi:hypothetical protein